MVQEPARRHTIGQALKPDSFVIPAHRALADALFAAPEGELSALREGLDAEAAALLMRLAFEAPPVTDRDKDRAVAGAVRYLVHTEPATAERRRMWEAIQAAQARGDEAELRRLQVAYSELIVIGRRG
jgi:hypothetical protein